MEAIDERTYYQSRDGFMTMVWGPMLWFVMHTVSFNYPCAPTRREKRHYRRFFESMSHVLPCGSCRKNLRRNMRDSGYDPATVFASRDALSRWVYRLHDCVNRMLGKRSPPFEDVRTMHERFRARCNSAAAKTSTALSSSATAKPAHAGCTDALSGVRSKCILRIVPCDECAPEELRDSLDVHPRCCRAWRDVVGGGGGGGATARRPRAAHSRTARSRR